MSELLGKMIDSSYMFIETAKEMIKSCKRKRAKVISYSRYIASFFILRAIELFESFLILIQADKKVDSVVLLRSLLNMAIDLGWILDTDKRAKEIRATTYLLSGDYEQKKILQKNLVEFKKHYPDMNPRLDELETNIKKMEDYLSEKYKISKWKMPNIYERAKIVGGTALNFYNQVYTYYSNIEHHSYLFGRAYVDEKNCEPIDKPVKISEMILAMLM